MKLLQILLLALFTVAYGQQYGYEEDYGQEDTLYSDYAARQQQKEVGAQGGGWTKMMISGTVGWLLGSKFHSGRLKKKLDKKHLEEQKALYQQYYNDVYTLQTQNQELINALEQYGVKVR